MKALRFTLAICCVAATTAVGGFAVGRRAASPARDGALSYEYRAVTLMDLLKDMPEAKPPYGSFSNLQPVWHGLGEARPMSEMTRVPPHAESSAGDAPKPPVKKLGDIDLQARVAAEINRMGSEGWELTTACKDAWPDPVPATGVMFFRRQR